MVVLAQVRQVMVMPLSTGSLNTQRTEPGQLETHATDETSSRNRIPDLNVCERSMKHAGMCIEYHRISKGLSQTQLAHRAGSTAQEIMSIETGLVTCTLALWGRLVRTLKAANTTRF